MKKQIKKIVFKFISIFSLVFFSPLIVLAQSGEVPVENAPTGLAGVLLIISDLLGAVLPILISLGVLYFIWGVVQYFIGDSEEAKKKGKDRIIYGIIGLAVIISIWGLVNILVTTFDLDNTIPTQINNLVVKPATDSGCVSLGDNSKVSDYLNYFTCIVASSVIPFLFALAILTFIWGVIKFFIINADEEKKRSEGKQFMLWGIIALAVMISIWGLVNILRVTFGFRGNVLPTVQPYRP